MIRAVLFCAMLMSASLMTPFAHASLPPSTDAAKTARIRPIPTPQFRYYGVADGLPSSFVYTMAQDARGVIWMGTNNGLVRFDSAHFRVFRHDPRQAHSLPANDVSALLVDHRQRLWVGGEGTGLNLYRPATGDFRTWRHKDGDPDSLAGDDVGALAEGKDGSIWVSVYTKGLDRLRPDGHIEHFRHRSGDPQSLSSDIVLSLHVAEDGSVLVGSLRGLDRVQPNGHIEHISFIGLKQAPRVWSVDRLGKQCYLSTSKGLFVLGGDEEARPAYVGVTQQHPIFSMTASEDGSLWLGMSDGMVWVGANGRHRRFPLHQDAPDTAPGALVLKIMVDQEGGLWAATRDNGVAYLGPNWRQFSVFRHRPGSADSIATNRVISLGHWQGRLFVGGQDGVLDSIDLATGKVKHFRTDLGHEGVTGLADAGHDALWVGHTNGLSLYRGGRMHAVNPSRMRDGVNRIVVDAGGNAFVSMTSGGVVRVDRTTLKVRAIGTRDGTTADRDVTKLAYHAGRVWRSSMGGLARLNARGDEFVDVPGVGPGRIFSFAFGAKGLWVVRQDALEHYRLESDGDAIRDDVIGLAEGWPEISVVDMARGAGGRIWMISRTGLWSYSPVSRTFHSYGVEDGLPDPEFIARRLLHMPDGSLFAGTIRGVVGWNPRDMHNKAHAPRLMLTRITVKRDGHLHAMPVDGHALHLRWNDRELHVAVQALSYLDPSRNHYRFHLQGLDSGWVDTGNRGERDFTGLSHGDYTLRIQASGPGDVWAGLPPLSIQVDRPPWLTWWAWTIYAMLVVLLFYAVLHLVRRRIEQRHRMQLAERERAMAEQASAAKTSFLATLGHEIRTPMTGVLGMAELLLRSPLQTRQREYAEAIQRSGTLLLRLVNEALDMARIEAGRLELDVAAFDPRDVLGDVLQLERAVAGDKGLTLASRMGENVPVQVRGDALRIKQILLNLVNNALKFTASGGVELAMDWVDNGLAITVSDTGPGISDKDRKRLFQRFEQADSPQRSSGSGLGLAICRELTQLMDGRCELVESSARGSTFRVWLPLPVVEAEPVAAADETTAGESWNLLLIEDDATVAGVIQGLLEASGHRVRRAPDGLAGLAELENGRFDALLLDLDLPGLDGFGVARMLRDRETDTRLPIIAITARSGGDEEERARAAGMDGFLRKPVSGAQLQAALAALLD
ncbi:hybrid sensor histidine kinase/response regulator [Oleiagrimonas sp. MCCC 1A03011]|uniref:hybrid sensor histidine kinase/response regulator n=1 Tax=Oleiagrimonas sp. MCCC 1A03011 TaxID=1926883 RepID=UPI0011BE9B27|nr:hybrid sensor histidine kinase/response regulator [Oleiagrimonas sp. MCCC 1A03011]